MTFRLLAVAVRLTGIGAILASIGAAFAYAAGWFSPERLRPDDIADSLEAHDGVHPGLRQRTALSRAGVFAPRRDAADRLAAARLPVIVTCRGSSREIARQIERFTIPRSTSG